VQDIKSKFCKKIQEQKIHIFVNRERRVTIEITGKIQYNKSHSEVIM